MLNFVNDTLCQNANHVKLSLLRFGLATVSSTWEGENPTPDFSRLYCILDGEASVTDKEGKETRLTKGHWVLLPAAFSFTYSCETSMEHFYFHLKLCDLDGRDMLSAFTSPVIMPADAHSLPFFSECLKTDSLMPSLLLRHRIEALLFRILEEKRVNLESNLFSP